MLFQDNIQQYVPFIIAGVLIIGGIVILKIGLAITKAQSKTNIKWVAVSYLIQYGVTLFVSSPMLLDMVITELDCAINGICDYYGGPDPGFIAMAVIFSTFLVLNLINLIHKPGLTRSFILTLLILGPIIGANYLIFS
ncbi:MAG: hypothetical protein ACFE8B_15930, partial [Candidatus Hermodarchaeota archaeon]